MFDLHVHSYYSFDGFASPEAQLRSASERGLIAVSITEHDNRDSWPVISELAKEFVELEIVPGVEFTCSWNDKEVGILGYWLDPNAKAVVNFVGEIKEQDFENMNRWFNGAASCGIKVVPEDLSNWMSILFPDLPWKWKSFVPEWMLIEFLASFLKVPHEEAERYHQLCITLGGYTPPPNFERVFDTLRSARALIVVAHPTDEDFSQDDLKQLIKLGVDGFEAFHPEVSSYRRCLLQDLASKHDLVLSSGSDSHGTCRGLGRKGRLLPCADDYYFEMRKKHEALYRKW